MADCDERSAVAAARILLSLRTRKLTRWPDYSIQPPSTELEAPAPSAEPEFELPPLPEGWPKRPRGPLFARASGWSPSLDGLFARLGRQQQHVPARSGAAEETARSPHRVREIKREFLPARRRSASDGSGGVSTSGAGEKVAARKEEAFVAASSPETPLDYAAAARSGASSSGDEGERSTAKRKARGTRRRSSSGDEGCSARADVDAAAARSGASSSGDEGERSTAKRKARATTRRSSSGDEGCSAPTKRARAADEDAAASAQATPAAVKVEVLKIEENYRDEKGHLLFDLNEDISMAWED